MENVQSYPGPVIYAKIPRIDSAIVSGLRGCGVATVVEAMGSIFGTQQFMGDQMQRRTTGQCIAGQALTVADGLADNLMMHAALQFAQQGDVLVVSGSKAYGAQWGELVTCASITRGLAGVVVDGPVRDVDSIEVLNFPVWATSINPLGARKDNLGWVNCPINCSGVYVRPGDIVVADGDGVVVVPLEYARETLNLAQSRAINEENIRSKANKGELPGGLTGVYVFLQKSGIRTVDMVWYEDISH